MAYLPPTRREAILAVMALLLFLLLYEEFIRYCAGIFELLRCLIY